MTLLNRIGSRDETSPSSVEFIVGIAHDLKTPLATITASAELLSQDLDPTTSNQLLAIIQRQALQMHLMVQDLADYFSSEAGEVCLHPETVDITALVTEICGTTQQLEATHNLVTMLPATPILANLRKAQVRRIIENLLSNAVKHTQADSIIVTRVRIVAGEAPALVIEVEDDGPGIPETERERVFEAYVRLGHSCSEGQGLGLQIVKQLAEDHGGCAWAESSPLGGARFCVRLPVHSSPTLRD